MSNPIDRLCNHEHLSLEETRALFDQLMQGYLDPVEIAALLIALKAKGETPDEIAGAAESMRAFTAPFDRPDYRFADTCGTGGDMSHTINISTAVAILAAQMEIPIAKHGNRSISSKCGSADVLEMLGVKIDADAETARRCLDEVGICFLFAPAYHPGMRFAMPVRQKLKTRTVFNILGPLANPARPAVQIVGVFDPSRCVPIAKTLKQLGLESALVVHGTGLDEIALHDETTCALLKNGEVTSMTLSPSDAGLSRVPLDALKGGTPQENADTLTALLSGQGKPAHVDAVAVNAGALAWIFGKASNLKSGCALAKETLTAGGAINKLKQFAEVSNGA